MKKCSYLLIFLISLICLQISVKAGWDDNGSGGTRHEHGDCPNCKYTYATNNYGFGIRLTLVDSNGNRIAGTNSYDFMSKALTGTVYSVRSKPDRYEVVNSNGVTFSEGYSGYSVMGDMPRYINVGKNTYTRIRDYIKNKFLTKPNGEVNETGTNQLLQYMGSSYDEFMKECNINIYLAIETIVVLKNGTYSSYYVGTASELANWEYHNKGIISGVERIFTDGTVPLSLFSSSDLAGVKAVKYYTTNNNIFNEMNKKSGNLIPGYGIFLFYLSDEFPECDEPKQPQTDICDFSLDIKIPGNCDKDGNEGYIKDTEDWECIFMSTLANRKNNDLNSNKIANHFYKWSNNYCAVYCREWVEYSLPGSSMLVLAGTHFALGNEYIPNGPTNFVLPRLNPITFTGRSECRVTKERNNKTNTNINYDKFKIDFANADKQVKTAWDNWQIAIKKDEAVAASTNVSSRRDCNWTCDKYYPKYSCPDGKGGTTTCGGGCKSGSYKNHKKKPATVYYNNGTGNKNVTPGNYCDSSTPRYVSNHQSLYNQAVYKRNDILKQIKDCNNFNMKNNIFEPVVDFQYDEPIYGKIINDLDYSLSIDTQTNYYRANNSLITTVKKENIDFSRYTTLSQNSDFATTADVNGDTSRINTWKCSNKGSTCILTQTTYPSNYWLKQWTTKIYDYKLPKGVYQNVSKPSGESYKFTSEVGTYKNSAIIPYSNLPVHYSTKAGRYDYQIKFDTLGTKSATNKHKFDYYLFQGGKTGQTFGEYYDVYYLMLNTPSLSSKLAHCNQADHLGHGMARELIKQGLINDFLNSSCASQHSCQSDGYNITCTRYKDDNGNWRTYKTGWQTPAAYTTYNQLVSCITSYAIKVDGSQAFNGDTKYKCTYNVNNKILTECENPPCNNANKLSDINVIFRPISLNDPFPGVNGKGRAPGENWNKLGLVNTYITNNRNVKTDKIYKDLDPLYKITLTPGLIKEIRKYNDIQESKRVTYYTNKAGKITGKAGYSDFNLTCDSNDKNCKSHFIRNTVSNYNFSRYFSGCGIKNKTSGLKCRSSDAW